MKHKRELIVKAQQKVHAEILGNASRGGMFAKGLASEGYAGGYRDALSDVLLLKGGTIPDRRGYWIGGAES